MATSAAVLFDKWTRALCVLIPHQRGFKEQHPLGEFAEAPLLYLQLRHGGGDFVGSVHLLIVHYAVKAGDDQLSIPEAGFAGFVQAAF